MKEPRPLQGTETKLRDWLPTGPSALGAAQFYIRENWCVVPLPYRSKAPVLRGWQNLRLRENELDRHFSNRCNLGLLLGEPSGGLVDVDLDCSEAIIAAPAFLPPTQMIHGRRSSRASHHWYLTHPIPDYEQFDDVAGIGNSSVRHRLVELRCTRHQSLVPPSAHPDGEAYFWEKNGQPTRVDGNTLREAVARVAACAAVARHWPAVGQRHDASLALCGLLLRGGWSQNDAKKFVFAVATAADDEEARDRERSVVTTARRLAQGLPATGIPQLADIIGDAVVELLCKWLRLFANGQHGIGEASNHLTDLGNAKRLVARHGSELRFCHSWGVWLTWTRSHWKRDTTGEIERRAKNTVQSIYAEAAVESDEGKRKALAAWARSSEAEPRIRAIISLARSESGIPLSPEEIDANQWLLNCANGSLNLRTGELHESNRHELCTKQVNVPFEPGAECPIWETFIEKITGGDSELAEFLQRAVGYSLTGCTREQVMFLLYGVGANGKTTFVETIRKLLQPISQPSVRRS